MNELAMALFWSAVQVTFLASAALFLAALVARGDARAGALVLVGALASCVLLTLFIFCPLPASWNWHVEPVAAEDAQSAEDTLPPKPIGNVASVSGELNYQETAAVPSRRLTSWLLRLLPRGVAGADVPSEQSRPWSTYLMIGLVSGTALCLARVLLGLWAVHRWRRCSLSVSDANLHTLLGTIQRAMGCRRLVEIHECADLPGAATVGWRRPLLLLPSGWRTWTEPELRAVLAHELAHIQAADYVTGLVARFSVALHFYHPLLHWLARRLQLQQELAADALGARFAGGRSTYLRALAQLALRQEDHVSCGPARAFLPGHGTLMRRIQMLRNKEVKFSSRGTALRRGLALALLVAAALGASALRGPADDATARAPAAAAVPEQTEKVPFDISYLDENSLGVVAFRPAVLLRHPEMKPVTDLVNAALKMSFLALGLKAGLPVEEIEQITGSWVHLRNDAQPLGQKNSLTVNPVMVRTLRPFDWKKAIESVAGGEEAKLLKVEHKGQAIWMFKKDNLCFHIPDDRTLVLDTEERLRRLIERDKGSSPKHAWAASWRQVEHGWFAMALHTGNEGLRRSLEEGTQAKDPDLDLIFVAPFVKNARSIAFGIEGMEQVRCHAVADCEAKENAVAVANQARLAVALGVAKAQTTAAAKDLTPLETRALHFAHDLAKSAKVETRDGDKGVLVEVRAEAKAKLAELLAEFVGAEMKAQGLERK